MRAHRSDQDDIAPALHVPRGLIGAHHVGGEIGLDGIARIVFAGGGNAIYRYRRVDDGDVVGAKPVFRLGEEAVHASLLREIEADAVSLADLADPFERVRQVLLVTPAGEY